MVTNKTVQNKTLIQILYYLGGGDGTNYYKDIYQFNSVTKTWASYGSMEHKKGQHAVELVDFSRYSEYCEKGRYPLN